MARERVAVLGAGFQGACVALALEKQGYRVALLDQAPDCMLRASLINEGKIHLGHLYANDPTLETSRLMLESALAFGPLLEEWVGPLSWKQLRSTPFTYVVARDTLLPVEDLFAHYEQLDQEFRSRLGPRGEHYLGEQLVDLGTPAPTPRAVRPDFANAAWSTPEASISPRGLRTSVRRALHSAAGVEKLYGRRVDTVTRVPGGFRLEGVDADGQGWCWEADAVVNCLWHGRLKIDRQLGLHPGRAWVYRLKYRILADLPESLRGLGSLTIVLGAFGDIVTIPHQDTVYLSWYPSCQRGWCRELSPPPSWAAVASGEIEEKTRGEVARTTLEAFGRVVPGLEKCDNPRVRAGIIFSWGETDIHDLGSALHHRYEIGPDAHDGYFSVDTGKLTCAPLFARQLVQRLAGRS